jgi:hypothetical protein
LSCCYACSIGITCTRVVIANPTSLNFDGFSTLVAMQLWLYRLKYRVQHLSRRHITRQMKKRVENNFTMYLPTHTASFGSNKTSITGE